MSQEGSERREAVASLYLAVAAYVLGVIAMLIAQQLIGRKLELRWLMVIAEGALAAPAIFVAWVLVKRVPGIVEFRPLSRFAPVILVLLGVALWVTSLGVLQTQYLLVKPDAQYIAQFQSLLEGLRPRRPLGWVFSIGAIAVAPAVCEEILFRGVLTPVFHRFIGRVSAIAISGVLFGIIHLDRLPNGDAVPYRVPFAIVLGMLLAMLRIDTGSLWPPIVAHAVLNTTTFLVVTLSPSEPRGVQPEATPLVAFSLLAVGLASSCWLSRRVRGVAPPAEARPTSADSAHQ